MTRRPTSEQLRAECAARDARIETMFFVTLDHAAGVLSRIRAADAKPVYGGRRAMDPVPCMPAELAA